MEIKIHRSCWKGILWLQKAHQQGTLTHLFQYHSICISSAKCFLLAVFHLDLCHSSFLVFRSILKAGSKVSERTVNCFEGLDHSVIMYYVWSVIQIIFPLAASKLHTAVSPLELQKMNAAIIYLVLMRISFKIPKLSTSIYHSQNYTEVHIEYSLKLIVVWITISRFIPA